MKKITDFDWKDYYLNNDENEYTLFSELVLQKDTFDMTWTDIVNVYNDLVGTHFTSDWARKRAKREELNPEEVSDEDIIDLINSKQLCKEGKIPEDTEKLSELDWKIVDLNVSKWAKSDERVQLNALYRRIAREISIREMGREIAHAMNDIYKLRPVTILDSKDRKNGKEAILQLSDWHYGVEVDSIYNKYNPDVAVQRVEKLKDEVFELINLHNIKHVYVVNLGDLIAGRIHLQLRINSRIDVITQLIEVTELLAQLLNELSNFVTIDYYDTMDNHSRLEPNLKNNIELESLTRVTRWHLEERLKDNMNIHINTDNTFGDDIIAFTTWKNGFEIAGVHGHKDNPVKVIDNLSMMTKKHYDLILSSHLHHFSADEKNETVLVSNSSLMGTDEYAQSLRLTSKPSQNLIVLGDDNPVYCIHKINL